MRSYEEIIKPILNIVLLSVGVIFFAYSIIIVYFDGVTELALLYIILAFAIVNSTDLDDIKEKLGTQEYKMATKGDRVGAIIEANAEPEKEATFAGYGVYKGDEIPPKGISIMGLDLNNMGKRNPRIDLDDGTTIWGCQCWWGPECQVKKMMENYKNEGYQITQADPDEYAPILAGETE